MQSKTDYRFEKLVNLTSLIVIMLGFAVAAWYTIADISPAYEINTLQAIMLEGDYFPILTIIMLVLPLIAVVLVIKTVLVFLFNTVVVNPGEPKIPYFYKIRWK